MDEVKQGASSISNLCPECAEANLIPDQTLGELFCPHCGFSTSDEGSLSTDGAPHGGTPSFPFLYDKGLSTSFNPSDVRGERSIEFRRLAFVDRAAKGIRPKESSILNVCRNILPILERNFGMSRGVIDGVKTKITEIIEKHQIPRIEGIYPALICYALLVLGVRIDRKKVLMDLTDSRPKLLRNTEQAFRFISKKEGWIYEFSVGDEDPVDQYIIGARGESKSDDMRGNASAWVSVVSSLADETEPVSASSRVVDGRLRIHLQTDKEVYVKGETIRVTAHVTINDDPTPLTDNDIQLKTYVCGGGRFRKAARAFWSLCAETELRPPPLAAEDYLKQCKLLTPDQKISALDTLSDLRHIAKLYGVHPTIRQLAAITARIHLLNYDDTTVANEFAIGVSALSSKEDFIQRVLGTNYDALLFSVTK
jgi:hypothetical protein